jgi:flotillin
VNAQLREQAEAAIKDKIATMSIEEVLTDKEPIIEELTTRLKAVSEGRVNGGEAGQGDGGLGIKIVTVQIKEAVVSSQRLWENLQAPFRNEKEQSARLSYLEMQEQIRERELESRRLAETSEAETAARIELAKQTSETDAHQARLNAENQRYQLQVSTQLAKIDEEARLNAARLEADRVVYQQRMAMRQLEAELAQLNQQIADELEIAKQSAELERRQEAERIELELQQAANGVRLALLEREAEIERLHQDIRNQVSEGDLTARMIQQLPELASHLPQPDEMHVLQTGGAGAYDPLVAFMMNMRALAGSMGLSINGVTKEENGTTTTTSS